MSDVIDLDRARRERRPVDGRWLACRECDLAAGPFPEPEAVYLALVHDQVLHRSRSTVHVGGRDILHLVSSTAGPADLLAVTDAADTVDAAAGVDVV